MVSSNDENAVEVWDRGYVAGITCQGAGEETSVVLDRMAVSHVDNFLGGSFVAGKQRAIGSSGETSAQKNRPIQALVGTKPAYRD